MSTLDAIDTCLLRLTESMEGSLQSDSLQIWNELESVATDLLKRAILDGSDGETNRAWHLKTVASTRTTYLTSFQLMRSGKYYEAWCKLEEAEISLISLKRNRIYQSSEFAVDTLAKMVKNWQSLYPYAVFMSPEFAIKREECSICGLVVDPWSDCKHEPGIVYRGKECYRIVKTAELLGMSLVPDPVQKYSVPFIKNDQGERHDHYDYTVVSFVVDRLRSAVSGWTPTWTKAYHPHELFKDIGPEDGCPCGSGRQYGNCCNSNRGVLRPHIEIEFDERPSALLPNVTLAGYKERLSSEKSTWVDSRESDSQSNNV